MRKILILPLFSLLVVALSVLPGEAHAATDEIKDQPSCQSVGGIWTSSNSTCAIASSLTTYDTWQVDKGVTLQINSGTHLSVETAGTASANYGIYNSGGTINNYGNVLVSGVYLTAFYNYGGTVNNYGYLDAAAAYSGGTGIGNNGPFNVYGTINNEGTLIGDGGFFGIDNNPAETVNNAGSMYGTGYLDGIVSAGTVNNAGSMSGTSTAPSGTNNYGIGNSGAINDYCGATQSGSYNGNAPNNISCYTVGFDQNGIPASGATWGVTVSWGPFIPSGHTGTGTGIAIQATGPLTYSYDTPVTSPGTAYGCASGCSGSATIAGATTFTANYVAIVPTSTSISCAPPSVSVGSPSTCTATVAGSSPTGTVTFSTSTGSTSQFSSDTCSLSSGSCQATYTPSSSASPVTITASYGGDPNNLSSSGAFSLTIGIVITTSNGATVCPAGPLSGTWSGGTCTVPAMVDIPSGMNLGIGPGVTINISVTGGSFGSNFAILNLGNIDNNGTVTGSSGSYYGIFNHGTINNYGNMTGGSTNYYGISNLGSINNYGNMTGGSSGSNGIYSSGGTINNTGSMRGTGSVGIEFVSGTINNNGTLGGIGGAFGLINAATINNAGSITGSGSTDIYNRGTITNECGGTVGGKISGNPTVNLCDSIPPVTTATLSGLQGTNGWYTSPVSVTLAASDNEPGGTGVKSTSYSLDGGPQATYAGPFTVTGDSNHTLAFNSTDNAGNVELPHLVYIAIDTAPPVITIPSGVTKEATGPLTIVNLGTATAVDAVDGPVTVTNNATVSYPVGNTVIMYSAADLAGNAATAYQKVTITDTTPPVLQLPAQITVQATGPSGATASYKANATDLVDGQVTPACSPASGSVFAYGNTTVTCTATDAHGNKAKGTFDVNVQNRIPPTISITSPANNAIVDSATVSVSGTASDIVSVSRISWKVDSGAVSAVSGMTPGPGVNWSFVTGALSPGSHTIQVNATDSAGLVAISSVSITYAAPTGSIPPPTGSGQITFTASNGGFTSLDSILQSSLPAPPPPGNYPLGFFSWDITGFAPSTSVTVTVTSPTMLPGQSQYFKLIGGTWIPVPVAVSGNTMTFTISDNGPYDGNPAAGVISDPAAVADPTSGRVTGGGNIGRGTDFGFEVHSNLDKAGPIRGTFEYQDRYVRLDLHGNDISFLSVNPAATQATFVGTGAYDRHYVHGRHDVHDTGDTFLVSVSDPDGMGNHDTLSVTVTNSTGYVVYQNSGTVRGHIEIHNSDAGNGRQDVQSPHNSHDRYGSNEGSKPDNGNHGKN
ncbi:MAG: HYR domain-containing protein [Thaumarchaeota archaeon]|nr:HYR domain-containing protein [Nitrososphaerota archaeon]